MKCCAEFSFLSNRGIIFQQNLDIYSINYSNNTNTKRKYNHTKELLTKLSIKEIYQSCENVNITEKNYIEEKLINQIEEYENKLTNSKDNV